MSELLAQFNDRMSKFEAELSKTTPETTASTSSSSILATEYAAFKTFVMGALNCLQHQVEALAKDIDTLEMRGRRKLLLVHGVAEVNKEETSHLVAEVVRDRLKIDSFSVAAIRRCHRMGNQGSAGKPRPILVKLQDVDVRDKIWFAKTKLKGSGITLSEFLTRSRHQVFMAARDKFGVDSCWTKQGSVYVLGADGTKHRVVTHSELNAIDLAELDTDKAERQLNTNKSASTPPAKRSRRAAAKK